jgi:histidyl-tRNA synthetase
VGTSNPAADAEVCMMAADTMEALGIARGQYEIKVSNRKILDGILQAVGLDPVAEPERRLIVLRAIDKLDRLGQAGVKALLGEGRRDESGDFTVGARLTTPAIENIMRAIMVAGIGQLYSNSEILENLASLDFVLNENFQAGLEELRQMNDLFEAAGYESDRIRMDPTIVRGLEYYTGPVFECELLMDTMDDDGNTVRFGSVGGGGRYDDLVARFTGAQVPATGFSIGVSRLYSALKLVGKAATSDTLAPVVVLVMDKERQGDYWRMVQLLRGAGIRAEMYMGTSNFSKQMKYADKRGAPLVVIQGPDELAKGEVQIKDLRKGSELAAGIETRAEYASQRLAQFSVPVSELVAAVLKALQK